MSDGYGLPMLSEHQAPDITDKESRKANNYEPTSDEKAAIKTANAIFERNKAGRRPYDHKWLDYYKIFRGRDSKDHALSYKHRECINMVFQLIQSNVPILTQARQRFTYLPQNPADIPIAKILDEVAESDWQYNNWTYELATLIYDSHIYGTGSSEVSFDADEREGLGSATFDSRDVFYCYPDPDSLDVNRESNSFVYARPRSIDWIKRQYPDKGVYVKADLTEIMKQSRTNIGYERYRSPQDNRFYSEGSPYSVDTDEKKDQALFIECYVRDNTFTEEEKKNIDEFGVETVEYIQKLKYPNGRKICIAGGVLLSDGPIPFEDGKFPFARLVNYIDPHSFWGISEIEPLASPYKVFNKLLNYVLDVLHLMGNPIWVISSDSGVDSENIFNRPGLVIEKNPNSTVERVEGVQLQPYVMQLIEQLRVWFNELGGSNDITRGINPGGVTAASAISSLQEAAQTRIRQKANNLDAFMQQAGQMYLSRVFQFYSVPRIVRVTGDETASRYFKFHVETVQDEAGNQKRIARVRDFVESPVTGEMLLDPNERQYEIAGQFDVKIETGSTLPFAKAETFNRAKEMFQLGIIDAEEVLNASDWPNKDQVMARMAEKAQQAAMAQMQAVAPQAGPPQPPLG